MITSTNYSHDITRLPTTTYVMVLVQLLWKKKAQKNTTWVQISLATKI
jgi:hypothetical protein